MVPTPPTVKRTAGSPLPTIVSTPSRTSVHSYTVPACGCAVNARTSSRCSVTREGTSIGGASGGGAITGIDNELATLWLTALLAVTVRIATPSAAGSNVAALLVWPLTMRPLAIDRTWVSPSRGVSTDAA